MKAIRLFLLLFIILFNILPASALDTASTPIGEFAESSPITISAYQTSGAGTKLAVLEVYNNSKALIDLRQWKLSLATANNQVREVATSSRFTGYLQPSSHVVYSDSYDSTYQINDTGTAAIITNIELKYTGQDKNYRPSSIVTVASDVPMFRVYIVGGYSTSTTASAFAAAPIRTLYDDGLYSTPVLADGLRVVEVYPYASDCSILDNSVLCSDYVKLQNTSNADILLDDLVLRTDNSSSSRTVSNTITLSGSLAPGATSLVNMLDNGNKLSLTNSGGHVWLEDLWGLERYDDTVTAYLSAGSKDQGHAYAMNQIGEWQWTSTPQPYGENLITEPILALQECPDGKYRNPETGRCRTIEEAVNALAACDEGSERNPVTNRCRRIALAGTSTLTPCLEGQERNPATNRCRSIAKAVAELLPCDEGYERNPATNRCRKVRSDDIPRLCTRCSLIQD